MTTDPLPASDFYTGVVAETYRYLRSETFDPEPYALFVEFCGQPALELGCGDGDPILDLRERGLDVEGLDSSADMLERCRVAAESRGLEVTLHHATFEEMDLGRRYNSIYLAGATFNLLPDDDTAQRALDRIAAHLEPGGSALIPLFVPQRTLDSAVGKVTEHVMPDGVAMSVTVLAIERDESARNQSTVLRYEIADDAGERTAERDWVLHWFDREMFGAMADQAGLETVGIYAADGTPSTVHDTAFTFHLRRADA